MVIETLIFIGGAIVGSFLNVCIVRMPHEKSVVTPRSHCVHCRQPIPWHDNIPFFSYIILRGRCRFCSKKISFRYLFVELVTSAVFLGFYRYFGFHLILLPYLVMVSCFIVATIVDFQHRIIPDEISVGGMVLGIMFSFAIPELHAAHFDMLFAGRYLMRVIIGICLLLYAGHFMMERRRPDNGELASAVVFLAILGIDGAVEILVPLLQGGPNAAMAPFILSLDASIVGVLVGGGSIYLMGMLGDFMFKKESMGGGDVKLLAMVGAFMGWQMAILTFFVAPFFGAVYGLAEKIRTKNTAIAYGPFLVLGALICLFWGDAIISWIMRGYGLY